VPKELKAKLSNLPHEDNTFLSRLATLYALKSNINSKSDLFFSKTDIELNDRNIRPWTFMAFLRNRHGGVWNSTRSHFDHLHLPIKLETSASAEKLLDAAVTRRVT
jgi:hypothetical protein